MATLKCKMCGGDLIITSEDQTVCECEYCGSKQTIPKVDDEKKIKLYERANRLRMANEFDKASNVYEGIIEEDDTEAEAYWGLLLCKYGIEYVDDPATGDKIPTCHRSSFDSIMDDEDFEMVMENSDALSRNVYREQAKQIEEIRKGIIEVSGKEEPYDIFICYKETDENGDRTIDSVLAQDVYDALTDKGYRVFFSRISLEDKLGTEYEPYIFAALNSANIMLAFGTSYDYYNAVWVKNEWSRYLKLMAKDKAKYLIPCFKDIDAYDMPKEFAKLQSQDMGKVGAVQDLLRGIDKILNPEGVKKIANNEEAINKAVASAMASTVTGNAGALLERGFMTLEDEDFEKADSLFEDVLNQNPKCAEAYMGKLMSYYKVTDSNTFANKIFNALFSELKEESIKIEYDIQDLIEKHYSLSDKISEINMKLIIKAFDIMVETNIDCLNKYDKDHDYIKQYCALDNVTNSGSKQDDKYYQRYLQYASEETYKRFNINSILENIVAKEKESEEKKIQETYEKFSNENIIKLLEKANENIKAIVGDELDKIESDYQNELSKWQTECDEITREWPTKRQQIQRNWEVKCEEAKQKYEQDKKDVIINNQKIKENYNQAVSKYEGEITSIDKQISELNSEFAGLGLFKGKRKEEIKNNIAILEEKKKNMKKPILADFGKIMLEPKLVLPEQPEISETPVIPNKPIRKQLNKKVDAEGILIDVFEKENISIGRRIVELGSYKDKPITWIILDKKDGKVLLLSEYGLDAIPYNKELKATTWEQCSLRKWLNNDFINEALSTEKSRICETVVTADPNPNYDTEPGNDTKDKVFLLSINEVYQYFAEDEERICYPTEYAKTTNLWVHDDEEDKGTSVYRACWWWLRSPGCDGDNATLVDSDGSVGGYSNRVDGDSGAIRPALWINLES